MRMLCSKFLTSLGHMLPLHGPFSVSQCPRPPQALGHLLPRNPATTLAHAPNLTPGFLQQTFVPGVELREGLGSREEAAAKEIFEERLRIKKKIVNQKELEKFNFSGRRPSLSKSATFSAAISRLVGK